METAPRLQPRNVWAIDSHNTEIEFRVKNLFVLSVRGRFKDFAGHVTSDASDVRRSTVEATIKAASIDTGLKRRDDHLRSADFLDVKKYPEIHFRSTNVERGRDRDELLVTGDLEIKGIRHPITLKVIERDRSHSPQGEEAIHFHASTEINRLDFGVKYGRGPIGSRLKVEIEVQL